MIQPVILCGGDGTRLWPASRKALPKQFMPLGNSTLYMNTLKRAAQLPGSLPPVILCNNELRFLAAAQAEQAGLSLRACSLILEPVGRNTAPAVTVAALHTQKDDPVLLVLPSDHDLPDSQTLAEAVLAGLEQARQGKLVTFGIVPDKPETGYGYIRKGQALQDGGFSVEAFVEKPDAQKAGEFLRSGNYFWNSGMFMFKASCLLEEMGKYAPEIVSTCAFAYKQAKRDLDFLRLDKDGFEDCPANSLDYAVMEHTDKAVVAPLKGRWSDLGSWESLYATGRLDEKGNNITGDVLALDSEGSFFMAQSRLLAAVGLKDMVVVETPDAVLVMPKARSQEVKALVARLREAGRKEVDQHTVAYRPWGSFECAALGDRFQVKRIIVQPGQRLSLQKHFHRAEHWVVVRGTALIAMDGEDRLLREDQSTYIPVGAVHRLENPGKVPLEIIEIQTGGYLGEDDIVRFEDSYGRSEE